jgi:hypothetical protein
MFLGVVLFCYSPTDVFTCSMVARTHGLFVSERECMITIQKEMVQMSEKLQVITRAKCFEVGKTI